MSWPRSPILRQLQGTLADALKGAHVFIGLSGPGVLTGDMVKSMAPDPIVFALANPDPEIHPEAAREAGAAVVATGRSDFPNQINNCLAFPGIFRGALDIRARTINDAMNIAAAQAIAALVGQELSPNYILPGAMDFRCRRRWLRPWPGRHGNRRRQDPDRTGASGAPHPEFIYDERLSLI